MKSKLLLLFFLTSMTAYSQLGNLSSITGKVFDAQTGDAVIGAIVKVEQLNQLIQTNINGEFQFRNVPPGRYNISCKSNGYDAFSTVEVAVKNVISKVSIKLNPSQVDDKKTFFIGGIEVTANAQQQSTTLSTSTKLTGGEIEHLQATSLSDVMQLLPGVQTSNPSLADNKQIAIRQLVRNSDNTNLNSYAFQMATLGTQIIVDDIPMSNNANMQGDLGNINSTAGAGADMRTVPVENIEDIEVIRGVPSARYGDLAGGAVKIKTNTKVVPNRVKFKYNPDTQELNFIGGTPLIGLDWNYNLNYARSVRDVRLDGDSYSRVTGQIAASHDLMKNWDAKHKLSFYRIFDEYPETGDPQDKRRSQYNRDFNLQYSLSSLLKFSQTSNLDITGSFSYTNQDSYYQEEVTRDNFFISTRTTPGSQQGILVGGGYLSKYWTKGSPILAYFNSEYNQTVEHDGLQHKIYSGINLKYEKNLGQGKVFDLLTPPLSSANRSDRPRSFDNIPGQLLASLFLVDNLKGKILLPFELEAGLRYELYDPRGVFNAQHGKYLNPRLNLRIHPFENHTLRIGYGISSKAPTLSQLYPSLRYFDVVDSSYYNDKDPSKSFSYLTTYVIDVANPNLKGFTEKSAEIGYDFTLRDWSFSATAYTNNTDDGINFLSIPYFLSMYSRPNYPSNVGIFARDTGVTALYTTVNNRYIKTKGIEFTMVTPTIYFLNGKLQIDAAYTETKTGQTNGIEYLIYYTNTYADNRQYFYAAGTNWAAQFLVNYRLSAASQTLGLWATITIQQMVIEKDQDYNLNETKYPLGYTNNTGKTFYLTEEQRKSPEYAKAVRNYDTYQYYMENKPNKFLINLRVSKSLFSGAEVSFFVNNLFNNRPLYAEQRYAQQNKNFEQRNTPLYYGIEFSSIIDKLY
jgi:outer membrane receptor for ferrienterochelin and colicin